MSYQAKRITSMVGGQHCTYRSSSMSRPGFTGVTERDIGQLSCMFINLYYHNRKLFKLDPTARLPGSEVILNVDRLTDRIRAKARSMSTAATSGIQTSYVTVDKASVKSLIKDIRCVAALNTIKASTLPRAATDSEYVCKLLGVSYSKFMPTHAIKLLSKLRDLYRFKVSASAYSKATVATDVDINLLMKDIYILMVRLGVKPAIAYRTLRAVCDVASIMGVDSNTHSSLPALNIIRKR